MEDGALTVWVASKLQQRFPKVFILHDHGQGGSEIYSYFGKEDLKPTFDNIVAQLDIAVVCHDPKKVFALIEIEETTATPKVILGDIFAILFGDKIASKGNVYTVDEQTILIVMVRGSPQSHNTLRTHLVEQITLMKKNLRTYNSSIEHILVETYENDEQLEEKLTYEINAVSFWCNS